MIIKLSLTCFLLVCVYQFNLINASPGDSAPDYLLCYIKCNLKNCQPNITQKYDNVTDTTKEIHELNEFERNQPYYMYLFGWDCVDECRYNCMWKAVENLTISGNITTEGMPQFGGKWPFVRVLFMQEPMSVLACIMNLLVNVYMLKIYHKSIPTGKTYLKWVWYLFGVVSIGFWLISIWYHIRDYWTSLNLDTFGAFFFLVFFFNTFLIRILWIQKGYLSKLATLGLSGLLGYSFYAHVDHMINVHFDFEYNTQVMLFVNGVCSVCWLFWSAYQYFRLNQKYVWRCAFSILLLNLSILLEFWGFEPLWYAVDSHALWHFSTVVIPVVWFKFLVDDLYRLGQELTELKKKNN